MPTSLRKTLGIRGSRNELYVGLGLFALGAYLLYNAERRGGHKLPWPLSYFMPY